MNWSVAKDSLQVALIIESLVKNKYNYGNILNCPLPMRDRFVGWR